jgi:hypothetical protein
VGRERELLEARLPHETRLLTLTGTGGIGKTRLALELAQHVAGNFADGAWLVELASLSNSTLVAPAIASVPHSLSRSSTRLSRVSPRISRSASYCWCWITASTCCLAAPDSWNSCCARLRSLTILATSREVLNVPGELAWLCQAWPSTHPGRDAEPAGVAVSDQSKPATHDHLKGGQRG